MEHVRRIMSDFEVDGVTFEQLERRAGKLIRSYWEAVVALADTLMVKRMLTYEEASSIMQEASPLQTADIEVGVMFQSRYQAFTQSACTIEPRP